MDITRHAVINTKPGKQGLALVTNYSVHTSQVNNLSHVIVKFFLIKMVHNTSNII